MKSPFQKTIATIALALGTMVYAIFGGTTTGCGPINPCHADTDCEQYEACGADGYCSPKPCHSDADCPGTTCGANGLCITPQPPASTSSGTGSSTSSGGGCEGPHIAVDVMKYVDTFNKVGTSPGEVLCLWTMTGQEAYEEVTLNVISVAGPPIQLDPGSCSTATSGSVVSCTANPILEGWEIKCPINNQDGFQMHNYNLVCDLVGITNESAIDTTVTAVKVPNGSCPADLDPDDDAYSNQGIGF